MSRNEKLGDSGKMQKNHQASQSKHSRQKKLLQMQVDSYYILLTTEYWDEQFKRTNNKMSGGLAALKTLKNFVSQSQLCTVHYVLIESHLRYADVIWGSMSKTKLAALQRLQSWACSIIANARIKDSWSFYWLNVENLFCYDRTIMTYKIVKID